MNVPDLLAELATLGGFAALIAVLVDIGKRFGLVKDGYAPIWSTGLNILALIVLFVTHIVGFEVKGLDVLAATLAQIGVALLALVGQFFVSKGTHFVLKGVPVVNKSFGAIVLLILVSALLVPAASAQTPQETVQAMFDKHSDFECVVNMALSPLTVKKVAVKTAFSGARNPVIDGFANDPLNNVAKFSPDVAQCFYYTWLFDRDTGALNQFKEVGSGVAKGHYAVQNRPLTQYDRDDLYWKDLNEVIYQLGGQPAFKCLDAVDDRPCTGWKRYPAEWIAH